VYTHPELGAIPHLFQEKFLVTSQGGLFTIKLLGLTKRQGATSCAYDAKIDYKAGIGARSALIDTLASSGFMAPLYAADTMLRMSVGIRVKQSIIEQWQGRAGQGRGAIHEFSRRSRNRLLRLGARLRSDVGGLMLTFTYRANMQDHAQAKNHLTLLSKWLVYHFPQAACIWRLEYQLRGAIHFHILALGVSFIDQDKLTAYWQELTSDDSYPDIKPIRSRRKVMSYISKYIAKMEQSELPRDDSGFISLPYSENFTGRFWGVFNRKVLPLAKEHIMLVAGNKQALCNIRRYARRKWAGMSRRIQGFSLFVNDASQWMRMVEYEIMRA
jgi:hypothetical protein